MNEFINFNGGIHPGDKPVFKASSRAARFGDGVFETMRMKNGKILFADDHLYRLFGALDLLKFKLPANFNSDFLKTEISKLILHHRDLSDARIRLMVSRGEGSIVEEPSHSPSFLIECWPVDNYSFNKKGLKVGIFENMKKSMDAYSSFKSCNYLPSVMATLFAKEQGLDECLLLNSLDNICDAAISNLYWVNKGKIFTPPVSEGAVAGIMRKYLLASLPAFGFDVKESTCTRKELHKADEVFLTNMIRGINWVESLHDNVYSNQLSSEIFGRAIAPLTK